MSANTADGAAAVPPPIVADPNPGLVRSTIHLAYDILWMVAIVLASPWWAGRSIIDRDFRRNVLRRLTFGLPAGAPRGGRRRILIHGVSVGEVKATAGLVEALRVDHPELEIVICTSTNTGEDVARKLYPDLLVVRLPVDVSFLIARFLRRVRPDCAVLVELEIWPNLLRQANRRGIPVAVVNGRITSSSFGRYLVFRSAIPQFNRITLFCAQNERYARRFGELAHSSHRIVVTGNVKYDGFAVGPADPAEDLRRVAAVDSDRLVIVAGSTHDPEERWVVGAWRAGAPGARLVIVPRHPVRTREIVRELTALGAPPQLLTTLRTTDEAPDPDRPLIVDTIGELEQVYGLADLVFVGGSLVPHGGQNVLEPASQGRPVLHGPHVQNFREEAALLAEAGASQCVENERELADAIRRLAARPEERKAMARAGVAAVTAHKGASALTLRALEARCLVHPGA